MRDAIYTMPRTWNYFNTGRGMSVDMSFDILFVRFHGICHLLHPKTIHISTRRILMSFDPYITIYAECVKKITSTNENIYFLFFLNLWEVWVDQRLLALPPSLLWISPPSWNLYLSNTSGPFENFHILLQIYYTFMFLGRHLRHEKTLWLTS